MADIHDTIREAGVEEARRQAVTKHERSVVEAAYRVLSEDEERMGFTYSGFALTSLPHKPTTEQVWRRQNHNITFVMQAGTDPAGNIIGLPYGSYARFILLYLQSEAISTQSKQIELGRCMSVWLEAMGLSIGGKTYRLVSEQARRISACNLQFTADSGVLQVTKRSRFVETEINVALSDQPTLWQESVILDERFFQALREHPVPVAEAALRAIGPRSMTLDIYVWLAYRLHALTGVTPIGWQSLYGQFGFGYSRVRSFRAQFIEALEIALAAYPDARVAVTERGVDLWPSRPPVPPRLIGRRS